MNARWLIVIVLLMAGIAIWFYQKEGSISQPVNVSTSELDYEATNIQAVQTNEQGDTEYQLDAKSLTFNPKTNQDEMSGITMNWQPETGQRYKIEAGVATLNQQTGDMRLSGGFELMTQNKPTADTDEQLNDTKETSLELEESELTSPSLIITGQSLQGNTKEKRVYSDEPVMVEQGLNSFKASSMQANLQTGEFEFGKISVEFSPPERQDKPLF